MYNNDESDLRSRLYLLVAILSLFAGLSILIYLLWAGYTDKYFNEKYYYGALSLFAVKMISPYLASSIEGGEDTLISGGWRLFLVLLIVNIVNSSMLSILAFGTGSFFAQYFPRIGG